MPNYYEILHLDPTASQANIEAAIDEQYQKWNQLVTHHDPKVAAQANQAKQTLQEIRTTLLDPIRRKVYDDAIGVGDTIGGLGDPEAILQAMSTPMGVPRATNKASTRDGGIRERTDAWICPKCSKANPIRTIYCENCATRLSANCPSCGSLSELNKKFCPKCGSDKKEVFNSQKESLLADLQKERKQLQQRKANIEQGNDANEPRLKMHKVTLGRWLRVGSAIAASLFFFNMDLGIYWELDNFVSTVCGGIFIIITIVMVVKIFQSNTYYKRSITTLLNEITQSLKTVNIKITDISSYTYKKDLDKLESLLKPSQSSEDELWEEYLQSNL